MRDPELLGDLPLRVSGGKPDENLCDFRVCQFRRTRSLASVEFRMQPMRASISPLLPAFLNHVAHVVSLVASEQANRIAATWPVAMVERILTRKKWTASQLKGYAIRAKALAVEIEMSVAPRFGSKVVPTLVQSADTYLRPEVFSQRDADSTAMPFAKQVLYRQPATAAAGSSGGSLCISHSILLGDHVVRGRMGFAPRPVPSILHPPVAAR
jgi:hypothetical protein